jgi:hypothetical protein
MDIPARLHDAAIEYSKTNAGALVTILAREV